MKHILIYLALIHFFVLKADFINIESEFALRDEQTDIDLNSFTSIEPQTTSVILTDFFSKCGEFQQKQKLFYGNCSLEQDNFYPALKKVVDSILSSNKDQTIDNLFRNQLLLKITDFFRNNYKNEADYIDALDNLVKQLEKLGDQLLISTKNVKLVDLYDAYIDSKMNFVVDTIINQTEILLDENYSLVFDYYCKTDSGFCGKSMEMYGIKYTQDITKLNVDEFLRKSIDNSYTKFNITSPSMFLELEKFTKFFDSLSNDGTKVLVSQLQNILKTELAQNIINYYDPNSQMITAFVKKTTTKKPTRSTTVRVKVLTIKAVEPEVYWTVPFAILAIGIFCAIALLFFFKSNKINYNIKQINLQTQNWNEKEIPLQRI